MSAYKIVILDDRYNSYEIEKKVLDVLDCVIKTAWPRSKAEAAVTLKDADAVICNLYHMDAELISALDKCRVISRYGVGYDNIDIQAASKKEITVCNVPDYAMEDASDHALALLFNCIRKISYRDRMIRAGYWNLHQHQPCFRMAGSVLGIVGFGHIGRTFVRKVSGFGFSRILIDDPRADEELIRAAGGEKAGLEDVLRYSDYISIHCPLKAETENMFDKAAFEIMKDGAILINTARGPIVNEGELYKTLAEGKLAAAGIDVYSEDPLSADSPLRSLDNITLTDHAAWYSEESIVELKTKAARNVLEILSGQASSYRVN